MKERLLCIDISEIDIKNRLDKISIHDSVDITKDKQGLENVVKVIKNAAE